MFPFLFCIFVLKIFIMITGNSFTWIPLYKELAAALLRYKDNRSALVDWIYNGLGSVAQANDKSLVGYLKMKDGSRISDIDPFSVFGIFNRNLSYENRTDLLRKFKKHLGLTAELPTDFNGIPTLNPLRAFFFSWGDDNDKVIQGQWTLFEKVLNNEDIEEAFNQVLDNKMPKYSLTMALYWIAPNRFLSLDSRNRAYLETIGLPSDYPDLHYHIYMETQEKVKQVMEEQNLPCSSFIEFSYMAWKAATSTPCVWMWGGSNETFKSDVLKAGSSAKGIDYPSFKTKEELGEAYRKVRGNTDVKIPYAYWELIRNVRPGDILVVFSGFRHKGKKIHKLYGWGRFCTECTFDMEDDNPIQRKVEWHLPPLPEPVIETKTHNDMFFHKVEGIEADNIIRLLGIIEDNLNGTSNSDTMANKKYKEFVDLLKENYNLVLTGAPGTGKTYMTQEIAKAMGTETETEFVQFHPSYDYTDFVEGLRPRPLQDEDGQMSFERKDGIFKEFCRKAIKNLADAAKSGNTLTKELYWQKQLEEFVDRAIDEEMKLQTVSEKAFIITDRKDNYIVAHNENNEKTSRINIRIDEMLRLLVDEVILNNVSDVRRHLQQKSGTQQNSYIFPIVQAIHNYGNNRSLNFETEGKNVVRRKNFVFIIDEINRGEASKIFGELFYAIDPGYRGRFDENGKERPLVKTQYQNLVPDDDVFADGFYVPENVYILATMNDIDRSVESMDFAMRRRFIWKEVTPDDTRSMLDDLPCKAEAHAAMDRLNKAIEETDGLGSAYMIGPAYFKKLKTNGGDFENLWNLNLEPLLKEYLRGFRNSKDLLKKFRKAYFISNGEQASEMLE